MRTAAKPQLAEDWDPKKVFLPCILQPKIDGVRGCNLHNTFTGRSLKRHANIYATNFFSQRAFFGMDGEMAAAHETDPALCRLTSSALSTIEGQPWLMWHVFDWLTPDTIDLAYDSRYMHLRDRVERLRQDNPLLGAHLTMMPSRLVKTMDELEEGIEQYIINEYEGAIVRDPYGKHKDGRSSPTHKGLLRIKTFLQVDAIVTELFEGQKNLNEATINQLGHTERSTHQANMVPNGMVGAMMARLCEDAIHPITKKLVHRAGEMVRFSAGRMTHDQRALYWQRQDLMIGQRIMGQIFAHGTKDKARMPTFQSIRSEADTIVRVGPNNI